MNPRYLTPETDAMVATLMAVDYSDAARFGHMQGFARDLERRLRAPRDYWQRQCQLAEEENDRLREEARANERHTARSRIV